VPPRPGAPSKAQGQRWHPPQRGGGRRPQGRPQGRARR
jgi:hypothetical protein